MSARRKYVGPKKKIRGRYPRTPARGAPPPCTPPLTPLRARRRHSNTTTHAKNITHTQQKDLSCGWHGKKNSYHRGIGSIACYIRKSISTHIQVHKINPLNEYIWIEISDTNAKKMFIAICYFAPINSTFYKKNNLDRNYPYNNLEQDIYSLKNEGNILLL
jgi:hypothetical protein